MYLKRSIDLCNECEDKGEARFNMLLYDSYEDYLEHSDPIRCIGYTKSYEVAEKLEYLFNRVACRDIGERPMRLNSKKEEHIFTNIYHVEEN